MENIEIVKTVAEMQREWRRINPKRAGWLKYKEIEDILSKMALERIPFYDNSYFYLRSVKNEYLNEMTLSIVEEIGWLTSDNEIVHFANETIHAFFAGVALNKFKFERALKKLGYDSFWRRITGRNDLIAISMVASSKNPKAMIIDFAKTDYLVAAKCLTSNGYVVPEKIREQIIRDLKISMIEVLDGGEWRSAYCATQLRLLGVAAEEIVPDIIKTLKIMDISYVRKALGVELTKFGSAALPFLESAWRDAETLSEDEIWPRYIKEAIDNIQKQS